jgi:AsmA-like C-terminal region
VPIASRRAAIVLMAAAGLLLTLAALSFVEFDATRLGRAALEQAGAVTGAKLTARAFRLRPVTGLVLEDVEASATFAGGSAAVTIDRLVLDHRFRRLLLGEVAVDRLVLRRPRIRLTETQAPRPAPKPSPGATAATSIAGLVLRVSRIDVEDGTIELHSPGQPRPVLVKGFALRLRDVALEPGRTPVLSALGGVGDVRVAEVALARSRVLDLRGSVRVGGGRFKAEPVRFRTDQGPFEATLDADLRRLPLTYALTLNGDPLDMTAITGARGFGAGTLRLDARGVGPEAEGLQGRGALRLRAGTLPAAPVLRAVEQVLGRSGLVGARYEATDAPFRIERGRVILDGFTLQTDLGGLNASGWASLAGPMELGLAVHTPRQGITVAGIGSDALDLLTDDQGRVVVPLKVTGTPEAPKVAPDVAALGAQAGRAGGRALIEKGVGALFRRKPKD